MTVPVQPDAFLAMATTAARGCEPFKALRLLGNTARSLRYFRALTAERVARLRAEINHTRRAFERAGEN